MTTEPVIVDWLVRGSAWLSFLAYFLTLLGWVYRGKPSRLRLLWTLAWAIFVVHVGLAFHLVHHWSHDAAWEATRVQGGVGEGIYFNYLVIAIWLFDILWWWLWPTSYLLRNRWKSAGSHGFLLFMWFNATVIFAHDYLWIVGAAGFLVLGICYLRAIFLRASGR